MWEQVAIGVSFVIFKPTKVILDYFRHSIENRCNYKNMLFHRDTS